MHLSHAYASDIHLGTIYLKSFKGLSNLYSLHDRMIQKDPVRIVSLLPSATELIAVVLEESACHDGESSDRAILVGRTLIDEYYC